MLRKVREVIFPFLIIFTLPLVASAQQLVAPISGGAWSGVAELRSASLEKLMGMAKMYIQSGTEKMGEGDRDAGLKDCLIGLSIAKYVQNRKYNQSLNESVKKLQKYLESAGVEPSVFVASEGTLASYLKGQSTALTARHQYNVIAVDVDGRPLAGVVAEVEIKDKGTSRQTVNCTTNESGRCPVISFEVNRDWSITSEARFSSSAKANGFKQGFYPASARDEWSGDDGLAQLRLIMIHPANYLDDKFAASTADRALRETVLRFLEVIRAQSSLVNAEVMFKGVGVSEFKGKKYLRLRVNSTTTYNSLKLNKYDIGKRLFDETVRKILSPLNENIAGLKAYYGYDIVIYSYAKSFSEKYASADKVEYRFLLPEAAVRRYKGKDISGQALLDAGVQLMDDERVEFKLQ